MSYKVGFIGVGNMGSALLRRIVKNDINHEFDLSAFDTNTSLLNTITNELNIKEEINSKNLVKNCDIIFLAIKPQYCEAVLKNIRSELTPDKILVSIVVGLSTYYMKSILGNKARIVRTMPNTPALVGEGMTLVSWDESIDNVEKNAIIQLLSWSGKVEAMDESLMSEVTALTGSSPAYVFMLIEAMADGAVKWGINRNQAYRLAAQAVLGSAKMVLETGQHPGELKDMVCSPGGTTIEAVAALEREGLRNAIIAAMDECTKKAREIGSTNK
ncbi:MAG: pyrroline-5-carboxylate reductase [Acetivibrionales bacterium]|jgi:pyrroline-5-carboxylate reductase|nr:pyrroline-5-carboxylate reductase [Clostridiaceae bacterium]